MPNELHNLNNIPKQYTGHQLCENITLLMQECKVSLSELHRNTGVPIATIQRIKTDPSCNPTIATLQPIADFFSITVSQLIGDDILPLTRTNGVYLQQKDRWIKVPIISWEDAVYWPNIELNKKTPMVSTDIDIGGNTFALKIFEDDWIGFQKNSIIVIDPNPTPIARDFVVVHKNGVKNATLKKYIIYEDIPYLAPLNTNFQTVALNEEYRILGILVQIRKDVQR